MLIQIDSKRRTILCNYQIIRTDKGKAIKRWWRKAKGASAVTCWCQPAAGSMGLLYPA